MLLPFLCYLMCNNSNCIQNQWRKINKIYPFPRRMLIHGFVLWVMGLYAAFRIWEHIATVPVCSSRSNTICSTAMIKYTAIITKQCTQPSTVYRTRPDLISFFTMWIAKWINQQRLTHGAYAIQQRYCGAIQWTAR